MQPGTDQWGQPNPETPSMQDSVVGGDINTGNVVHNYYQTSPVPPAPIIIGQPQAAQPVVGTEIPGMGMPATSATIALVLAILSIFVGCLTGLGICLAIPGLMIANQALAITDQHPGHPDAGSANAAKIISWIVIGLTIVVILFYVFFIVIIMQTGF